MSHENIRLETKDGDVIVYMAPSFEWEPTFTNSITNEPIPGKENAALALDLDQWIGEITIQGQFDHSENLPAEHINAIETNLGITAPFTARDQVNYAIDRLVFDTAVEPPYNLYIEGDRYIERNISQADPENGLYPNVTISEIRRPQEAGFNRLSYLFRFVIGRVD